MKSQLDKFIDACNAEDHIIPVDEINELDYHFSCFDCINWQGWKCIGECIKCVDFNNFKQR